MTPVGTPGPAADAVRLRADAVALVDAGRCEDATAILALLLAAAWSILVRAATTLH